MKPRLLALALIAFLSCLAPAQSSYLGARDVLRAMEKPPAGSSLADPRVSVARDWKEFGRKLPSLIPDDAVAGWLRIAKENDQIKRDDSPFEFNTMGYTSASYSSRAVSNLPPPSTWPTIELDLRKQSEQAPSDRAFALLALFDALQGHYDQCATDLSKLKGGQPIALKRAELALALKSGDKGKIVALLSGDPAPYVYGFRSISSSEPYTMEIPDLISLLGEREARKVLTHLLNTVKAELVFGLNVYREIQPSGSPTEVLARQLATEQVATLAWPQWALACSWDGAKLFEALHKRFIPSNLNAGPDSDRIERWVTNYYQAATWYVAGLVIAGKTPDARAFMLSDKEFGLALGQPTEYASVMDRLQQTGSLKSFIELLESLGEQEPGGDYATAYLQWAKLESPLPDGYVAFAMKVSSAAGKNAYQAQDGRKEAVEAMLRSGDIAQAIAMDPEVKKASYWIPPYSYCDEDLISEVGEALKQTDFKAQILDQVNSEIAGYADFSGFLMTVAIDSHLGPKVEEALIEKVKRSEIQPGEESSGGTEYAKELLQLYNAVDRPADVLTLLEKYPDWSALDVTDFGYSPDDQPLPSLIAAKALAAAGRPDEALNALKSSLLSRPDDDAYELLLKLDPHASDTLDALHAQFPKNNRPLIWKADLLMDRANKEGNSSLKEEARSLLKQANQLDPADLESWGSPTRFKAYDLLDELDSVPSSQNTWKGAARLALRADYFHQEKLDQQAIALYESELNLCPFDFRSRVELGTCLIEAGKAAEGENNVKEGYSQMQDEIGDFDWQNSYTFLRTVQEDRLAESALNAKIQDRSINANGYAILGVVYYQLNEPTDAWKSFESAITLEQDNYQAWEDLLDRISAVSVPPEIGKQLLANIPRLGLTGSPSFGVSQELSDAEIYNALAGLQQPKLAISYPVVDLRATMDKLNTTLDANFTMNYPGSNFGPDSGPAEALLSDPLILQLATLLDTTK